MSSNNSSQYAVRDIKTHDLVTGEELLIVFYPDAEVLTINAYTVTRSQSADDLDEKAVFHPKIGDKVFTVAAEKLSELFF